MTPIFNINETNVQYDLRNIDEINKMIDDYETSNIITSDYRYYFQFESLITNQELPTTCSTALLSCDFETDPNCQNVPQNNDSVGVAYRVDNSDRSCVVLGEIHKFKTSLFDTKLPAKGVRITYEGGYNTILNTNYKFHIDLECPNMSPDSFKNENKMNYSLIEVTKYDDATYSVHFITPLSCPIQCQNIDQISICNGRGLCALDPYDKITKCICDTGFEGALCENEISLPHKHNDTAYIVVVVLLIITIGIVSTVGIFQYIKWKQRANVAYADLALRQCDLANGLMMIKETSTEYSDDDNFMFDDKHKSEPVLN